MTEPEHWSPEMLLGEIFSWGSQARQYARTGDPGIGYERHYADGYDRGPRNPVDCLLMRDVHGDLVGILNHYPEDHALGMERAGNINVWVRPDRQKRGIATRLVREAQKRWAVNAAQQRYTPEGLRLLASLERDQQT
jgi:GNAT superfamily N-acetyltransferase